jgi:hypothetical protein
MPTPVRSAGRPARNTGADRPGRHSGIGGVGYIVPCPPRQRRVRPALMEAGLSQGVSRKANVHKGLDLSIVISDTKVSTLLLLHAET